MMKRLVAMLLAMLMVLSLVGCGSEANLNVPQDDSQNLNEIVPTEPEVEFYTVEGVRYPAALGAPILGEAAAELATSLSFSQAAKEIKNVGDAYYYLAACEPFNQPHETSKAFIDLLASDYDEVGLIFMERIDNGYCVAYIKSGENYYPFDPFSMADAWTLNPQYDCISNSDLEALGEKLMKTCPYNANRDPMTSWWYETMDTYSKEENAIIARICTPLYTQAQIEQWVADGLTVEQWAEKITTPADAVQLLWAINYREKEYHDNDGIRDDLMDGYWAGCWNAQTVFDYQSGNCGGTSNIINYLLTGDFEEQGYVEYGTAFGGHIFNYFVIDGIYVMCDFVGVPGVDLFAKGVSRDPYTSAYVVYMADSPQEFADWYRAESRFANQFVDPNSEHYLYNFFMYPCEGTKIPKGHDRFSEQTKFDNVIWDILPEQYKDIITILYEREGYPVRFAPIPDKSTWPAVIR